MLVLSRREKGGIKIGSDVTVTVLSIHRQQVRLGIQAPDDVRVLRDELCGEVFEETRPVARNPGSTPRMKIVLVIEDDPLHARLIRKSLCGSQGTMVTVAETAKLALDALGALAGGSDDEIAHPDLILLDMHLPDSTGLEVLRAIRRDDRLRATPVVMLSCCDEETVVQQCVETGANAFVVKSPQWDDFRASVSRIGDFWMNDSFAPQRSRNHSPAMAPSTTAN